MKSIRERLAFQKRGLFLLGGLLLLVLFVVGILLWNYHRGHVSTDDAFVEGRASSVSALVTGAVKKLLVDDNEEVKQGQVLVEIDPKYYQARLDQAEAAVAIARAELKAAEERIAFSSGTVSGQVAQAEAALDAASTAIQASQQIRNQAKSMLASKEEALAVAEAELRESHAREERARIDFDRMRRLLEKKAVSKIEADLARADYDAALAEVSGSERKVQKARRELDAARSELKAKETGYAYSSTHLGVKSAKAKEVEAKGYLAEMRAKGYDVRVKEAEKELAAARLEEALANLKYAREQLEDTVIRAPMAGRVTKRNVEVGQVVHPGQPLMAIVSLSDIWVVANYKETQLTAVRAGQRVEITVDAYPGEVFTGRVESIQAGTGARFSLLPPENATGNFVKVVQRVPVKIVLDKPASNPCLLRLGMSVVPTIELD